MANLFTDIKETLDFLAKGHEFDPYYLEKLPAKKRFLVHCIKQVECIELRRILLDKAKKYRVYV